MRVSGHMTLAALFSLALAAPAAAQRYVPSEVEHRTFSYLGSNLTIEVASPTAGELHVMRGRYGVVEVTGRARDGFFGASLAEHLGDRLRLVAVGAERVDYLVVVPEDARVRVVLPDRRLSESVGGRAVASYEWGEDASAAVASDAPSATGGAPAASLQRIYLDEAAPRVVSLPDTRMIRKITVRTGEGDWFEVSGSRAMRLAPGSRSVLEIRPTGEPVDLEVTLPRRTSAFVLRIGKATALSVDAGRAVARCAPVIEQKLDDGRRSFTFTPADRALDCRAVLKT